MQRESLRGREQRQHLARLKKNQQQYFVLYSQLSGRVWPLNQSKLTLGVKFIKIEIFRLFVFVSDSGALSTVS